MVSTKKMTDELAIELVAQAAQFPHAHGRHKEAIGHIADRLRELEEWKARATTSESALYQIEKAREQQGQVVAWMADDGTERIITAKAKAFAERSAAAGSAMRAYTIPLVRGDHPQPVDDPELDGTDDAHPAWWRGSTAGVAGACERIEAVLDGKDSGAGVLGNERLERLRRRLLAAPTPSADRQAIRMLVAASFVDEAKANEALQIAHGFATGELAPAPQPEAAPAVPEGWALPAAPEPITAQAHRDHLSGYSRVTRNQLPRPWPAREGAEL